MESEPVYLRVDQPAQRLDRFLVSALPGLSRSLIQRLITEGQVLVNGRRARASYLPTIGDLITVAPSTTVAPPLGTDNAPLVVVYEDEHMLVVDKPAGLVVHAGTGHPTGTLLDLLLAYRPDITAADLDPRRPGIVHRLDKDTSGLLMVAATRSAQELLQAMLKARTVRKTYLALVYGHLRPDEGAIDAPVGRDPQQRTRRSVRVEGGRPARTEYRARDILSGCTLLEARPITGRMHQLRVHLAAIGHPVVGDRVYGPSRQEIVAPRQMLHAWRLALLHPITGAQLELVADPPADMRRVLDDLRAPL